MVNVKKERIVLENQLKQIGDGSLAVGYGKLGLPDKYLEGGSARRRFVEVRNKINNLSAPAPKEEGKDFTEEELEDKTFKQLKAIGNAMGTTGRGKQELIDEILEIQENKDE